MLFKNTLYILCRLTMYFRIHKKPAIFICNCFFIIGYNLFSESSCYAKIFFPDMKLRYILCYDVFIVMNISYYDYIHKKNRVRLFNSFPVF